MSHAESGRVREDDAGKDAGSRGVAVWTPWWPTMSRPWFGCFVRNQAQALADVGVRVGVDVIVPPWERERPDGLDSRFVVRQKVVPLLPRYVGAPATWRFGGWRLERAARGLVGGCALVHTEILGAIAGPALKAAMVPYWIVIHGEDTSGRPISTRRRREAIASALRGARGVILVGRPLVPVALSLGADRERCHVIENGYDPEVDDVGEGWETRPGGQSGGGLRIACVGNLQPEKGQEDLLLAMRESRARGVEVHADLVGAGRTREALVGLVEALGLSDSVTFHGALPPREAAIVISRADVFVLPSRREALGIVYLNAMALGKPVVGVLGTGIDGIVENGKSGFLCPAGDVSALAGLLESLANDRGRALTVGEVGRGVARGGYSWRANAERLLEVVRLPAGRTVQGRG